jgi:hypothetical protein
MVLSIMDSRSFSNGMFVFIYQSSVTADIFDGLPKLPRSASRRGTNPVLTEKTWSVWVI